ncbi:MAG: hypothetical protein V3U54_07600 [Thermodesulfobacteriota bacterium]
MIIYVKSDERLMFITPILIDTITKKEYNVSKITHSDPRAGLNSISITLEWPDPLTWKKESKKGRIYRLKDKDSKKFDEFVQLVGHSGLPNGLSSYFQVVNNLIAMEQAHKYGKKNRKVLYTQKKRAKKSIRNKRRSKTESSVERT